MKKVGYLFESRFRKYNTWCVCLIAVCLVINALAFSATSFLEQEARVSIVQHVSFERNGWESIESGVTQDLNSVFFICLNRGSVVGNEGVIILSGDGGNNWTEQNSGVFSNLYDIFYYGFMISVAVGAGGTILYSNNSGQDWTIKQTGMTGSYYSGQMITDTIGVAVGVNAIFQPFFTRTNNGWDSWQSTSFYIMNNSVSYEGYLSDVYFINSTVGFASAVVNVPTGGAIVRTTDGGSSWQTIFFSPTRLFSIDFVDQSRGYAVGDQGVILRTLDSGLTWQYLESGVNNTFRAVDFSSETTGTIVGDNGIIMRTINEGLTWAQQTSGTTYDLSAVHFVTDFFGVVVGNHGVILRTYTGGNPEDINPPETTCNLSGTIDGDIYISDVTVTFTATDDNSGVATTFYKLDDASWTPYEGVPFIVQTNGYHLLHFYSIDNAGNIEGEKTCEFTIQHPLNITVSITGGFGYKVTIQNSETFDLMNISWDILLDGGIILLGQQKSGKADIKAGGEITLRGLVFGFGAPTCIFRFSSYQKRVQSRVFLFFVRV